jgi:AraC-like DNA-binding protein
VFLSAAGGTPQAKRSKLSDLSERVATLAAKSFGLSVHFGASIASGSAPLSRSYQAALAAAQASLTQGVRLRMAEAGGSHNVSLFRLRKELATVLEQTPGLVPAHFDRYLEVVAEHAGHRMDTARAHLEIAFERMTEAWIGRGALDEKSVEALREGLDRTAGSARTLEDLFGEYRRAVADVALAAQRPGMAQRDRSLRRAVSYIQEHYTEPLRLEQVAAVAGFAPKYFSRLFAEREHVPFARYVLGLRLERAKQLLASTEIEIVRVAELCGFGSPQYFATAFREATHTTPMAFRREPETMSAAGKRRGGNNLTRNLQKRTTGAGTER